jgi:hypothetical protein
MRSATFETGLSNVNLLVNFKNKQNYGYCQFVEFLSNKKSRGTRIFCVKILIWRASPQNVMFTACFGEEATGQQRNN